MVATRVQALGDEIRDQRFRLLHLCLRRCGRPPWAEHLGILELIGI